MILDCTFRDGGYYTNWTFDKDMARETVRVLDNTNKIEYIELGYKSPTKGGPYKKCNEEYIRTVLKNKPNTKLSFMVDLKEFNIEDTLDKQLVNDIIPHSKDSWFSLVRIALTKANLTILPDMVKLMKEKKYIVGVNLMQVDLLKEKDFINAIEQLRLIKHNVDYFYVADSFGTIQPSKLEYYKNHYSTLGKIGFHAHDNLGLAFANILEAEKLQYDLIDTTLTGMGRGVGNAKTEQYLMLDDEISSSAHQPELSVPLRKSTSTYVLPQRSVVYDHIKNRGDSTTFRLETLKSSEVLGFRWFRIGKTNLRPIISLLDEKHEVVKSYRLSNIRRFSFNYKVPDGTDTLYLRISDETGFIEGIGGSFQFFHYLLKSG